MAIKVFFCVLLALGASGFYSKVTEEDIEKLTNQIEALKPLVEGTNATFGELLDAINETVSKVDTTASTM